MTENVILCVDDELDILDSLCALLLEEFGGRFEIEKAQSAQEAYEVIDDLVHEGLRVILIVSDWLMPGIRGDDFLISVHRRYPGIVKIMLTGQADKDAVQNARDNAALFACIRKPWDTSELIAIIREGVHKI